MDRPITWPARAALAAVIIGIALVSIAVKRSSGGAPPPSRTAESADVRVLHEFITITSEPVAPAEAVAPAAAGRTVAAPRSRRVTSPNANRRTFAEKAKRAVLGDGRYRPEPFPRR